MYHSHCDVTLDEYITDKVQNQRGGKYSFSLQKYKKSKFKLTTFGKK